MKLSFPLAVVLALLANLIPTFNRRPPPLQTRK